MPFADDIETYKQLFQKAKALQDQLRFQ